MTEYAIEAFLAVMTLSNLIAMIVGTIAGIIIGALPGINVTAGIGSLPAARVRT